MVMRGIRIRVVSRSIPGTNESVGFSEFFIVTVANAVLE